MVGSRLLLIPVIAAVGYEILKFGARHRANPLVKVLMYPGILVQMITTKRPEDDMIEVAIASMEEALVADGNEVPAGSADLERAPMRLGPSPTVSTIEPVEAAAAVGSGEPPTGA